MIIFYAPDKMREIMTVHPFIDQLECEKVFKKCVNHK